MLLQQKHAHLIEVSLQRFILRILLRRKRSLGLGAMIFDLLLASVLLHRGHEAESGKSQGDYEQLQPLPDCLIVEACPSRLAYPRLRSWLRLPD